MKASGEIEIESSVIELSLGALSIVKAEDGDAKKKKNGGSFFIDRMHFLA